MNLFGNNKNVEKKEEDLQLEAIDQAYKLAAARSMYDVDENGNEVTSIPSNIAWSDPSENISLTASLNTFWSSPNTGVGSNLGTSWSMTAYEYATRGKPTENTIKYSDVDTDFTKGDEPLDAKLSEILVSLKEHIFNMREDSIQSAQQKELVKDSYYNLSQRLIISERNKYLP